MRIIGNAEKAREVQAVASGVLPSGKPVVVNADGTVSVVAETAANVGTPSVFENAVSEDISSVYDANSQKLVVTYKDGGNSNSGTAVVGTVSNTSISFGTPVVFDSSNSKLTSSVYDANSQKLVVTYKDSGNSNYGTAVVGTVSGTSISFGTPVVFQSTDVDYLSAVYDANAQKIVIAYRDDGNSNYGTAVVGTVSGTSISFGSPTVFESAYVQDISATYAAAAQKVVISYKDYPNSQRGTAIVGTVSGTSISFGTAVVFQNSITEKCSSIYDSTSEKVVIAYYEDTTTTGKAVVGTVSGTSISFGAAATFTTSHPIYISTTYDSNAQKVVVAYSDYSNSRFGTVVSGSVSGTSISFETPTVIDNSRADFISTAYDSVNGKVVVTYSDVGNSGYGTSAVHQPASTNLTSENYIGTAATGAPDGQGAKINIKGAVADVPVSNYNIASASYDNKTLDVSGQEGSPRGMVFNSDGTKVYVVGTFSDNLSQYNCSTAYDISTASYSGTSFSFASQDTQPHDIVFNNDGTKLYMMGLTNDTIFRYSLSSAYNISTLSYDSVSFSVGSQATSPRGLTFGSNGNKLYVSDEGNDRIYEYNLSTAYDATSASYNSVNFDPTSEESNPSNVAFNSDGTKMFIAGNNTVYQYSLSTAFDLSTVSYDSISFNVSSQVIDSYDIHFNPDGSKMYIVDIDNTALFQYSTSVSLTPAQSYFVQTDGTLGTTAGDPSVFAGTAVAATKLIVKG